MNKSAVFSCYYFIPLFIGRIPSFSICLEFLCILILTFVFKAGQAKDFLEPLLEAKKAGLKLALHLSEVNNTVKLVWRG